MGFYDIERKQGKLEKSFRKLGRVAKRGASKAEGYLASKARKKIEKMREENRLYEQEYNRVKKQEKLKHIRRKARKDAMGIFSNLGHADSNLNYNVGQILGFNFPKPKQKTRRKKKTRRRKRPRRIEYYY